MVGKKYTEKYVISKQPRWNGFILKMTEISVKEYVEQLKDDSNLPLDLSVVLEPFGLYVNTYVFEGVLLGIFLEDMIDQYAMSENIDVYTVLELVAFYANELEINTIIQSLIVSTRHGACNSL